MWPRHLLGVSGKVVSPREGGGQALSLLEAGLCASGKSGGERFRSWEMLFPALSPYRPCWGSSGQGQVVTKGGEGSIRTLPQGW